MSFRMDRGHVLEEAEDDEVERNGVERPFPSFSRVPAAAASTRGSIVVPAAVEKAAMLKPVGLQPMLNNLRTYQTRHYGHSDMTKRVPAPPHAEGRQPWNREVRVRHDLNEGIPVLTDPLDVVVADTAASTSAVAADVPWVRNTHIQSIVGCPQFGIPKAPKNDGRKKLWVVGGESPSLASLQLPDVAPTRRGTKALSESVRSPRAPMTARAPTLKLPQVPPQRPPLTFRRWRPKYDD